MQSIPIKTFAARGKMNERTVVAMKDDGACFTGVHGDTIMFADVVQRQDVGNLDSPPEGLVY